MRNREETSWCPEAVRVTIDGPKGTPFNGQDGIEILREEECALIEVVLPPGDPLLAGTQEAATGTSIQARYSYAVLVYW